MRLPSNPKPPRLLARALSHQGNDSDLEAKFNSMRARFQPVT